MSSLLSASKIILPVSFHYLLIHYFSYDRKCSVSEACSVLRGGLWTFSPSETWNKLLTSIFCVSLVSRMPLNKVDAFDLLTCANAFHHSNMQHNNREWWLLVSQWKTDFIELKPAIELQMDRWTEIQQNSPTPPCWMHHWCTTSGCPAWNEEA